MADPGGGREVPDRVRPAEAVCDVRRQAAERPGRRADAVASQPHLRPRRDPQGRHVRAGLSQRRRRHPGGVRALVRRDGGAADRPQPALRHPPCAGRVWGAVARRDRTDRRPAAGQGRHGDPAGPRSAGAGDRPVSLRPRGGRTGAVPRRPGPLRAHLRVSVAGGGVHRHQAGTRLSVLQGPRCVREGRRLDGGAPRRGADPPEAGADL